MRIDLIESAILSVGLFNFGPEAMAGIILGVGVALAAINEIQAYRKRSQS